MVEKSVRLHLQKVGSDDCGPMGTLMILDYFGVTSDEDEVLKKVKRSLWGTSTFSNASVLKDYGLDTTLVTIQPKIFYGEFINSKPNTKMIIERIRAEKDAVKAKSLEDANDKKANLQMLINYLEAGGKLELAIPSKRKIISALEDGKLVWASTYNRILGKDQGGHHTVVIAGHKNNKFLVYNPLPLSRKRSWEDDEKVMFAIHSVTDFGYDNGAIILVGKK